MDASVGFEIDPNIRRATLPPGALYGDPAWFEAVRRRVLARSWHLLHAVSTAEAGANAVADTLGGEPVVWTVDPDGAERLLSNVCTHRGATVVEGACRVRHLRCPYHGRRWSLDGRLSAAPGFEGAEGFPAARDDLSAFEHDRSGPWHFGADRPSTSFEAWFGPVRDRLPWFPWDRLAHDPTSDRDYEIEANWALYVDNYLEGFHVPYVHPGLAQVLDPRDYRHETLPLGTLQIGRAQDPADAFDVPAGDADAEIQPAGYYFWLFPTTMVNCYPWGVSLNLIDPLGPQRTRIRYRTWVSDPSRRTGGAGGALDEVELEDQAVVRRAQRGVRALRYPGGRYAPEHEVGLHHFHRLLAASLR